MRLKTTRLQGFPVLLSASMPLRLAGTPKAQDMNDFVVAFVGGLLSSGGTLVFGGHPYVTPLVHRVARSLDSGCGQIRLFQAARYRSKAPEEVSDRKVFPEVHWIGKRDDPDPRTLDRDLTMMRRHMVKAARAGVFIGGKTEGFGGKEPGIRVEFRLFAKTHLQGPAYLLGLLDGETQNIIEKLEAAGRREPNSLSEEELEILHHTDNVDLAASLVLADLERVARKSIRR